MAHPKGKWVQFTKRTDEPKLSWLEEQLEAAGIAYRRNGRSFHAPILEVREADEAAAWAILTPVDDIDDDDAMFQSALADWEVLVGLRAFASALLDATIEVSVLGAGHLAGTAPIQAVQEAIVRNRRPTPAEAAKLLAAWQAWSAEVAKWAVAHAQIGALVEVMRPVEEVADIILVNLAARRPT